MVLWWTPQLAACKDAAKPVPSPLLHTHACANAHTRTQHACVRSSVRASVRAHLVAEIGVRHVLRLRLGLVHLVLRLLCKELLVPELVVRLLLLRVLRSVPGRTGWLPGCLGFAMRGCAGGRRGCEFQKLPCACCSPTSQHQAREQCGELSVAQGPRECSPSDEQTALLPSLRATTERTLTNAPMRLPRMARCGISLPGGGSSAFCRLRGRRGRSLSASLSSSSSSDPASIKTEHSITIGIQDVPLQACRFAKAGCRRHHATQSAAQAQAKAAVRTLLAVVLFVTALLAALLLHMKRHRGLKRWGQGSTQPSKRLISAPDKSAGNWGPMRYIETALDAARGCPPPPAPPRWAARRCRSPPWRCLAVSVLP